MVLARLALFASVLGNGAAAAVAAPAPGIVLVVADDMRQDDLAHMPRVERLLAAAGTSFSSYVANVPLCCPARATMLRGQYSHNTGVRTNSRRAAASRPPGAAGSRPTRTRRRSRPRATRRATSAST